MKHLKFILFLLFFSGIANAAERFEMYIGEIKILKLGNIERIAVGNPTVVSNSLLNNGQLILIAEEAGSTKVHIWFTNGNEKEYMVHVSETANNLVARKNEVQALLADVPGINVDIVGERIVLSGEVPFGSEEQVVTLIEAYPEILNSINFAVNDLVRKKIEIEDLLSDVEGLVVRIVGENIVKELAEVISGAQEIVGFEFADFENYLMQYRSFKLNLYKKEINEEELTEKLEDRVLAVKAVYQTRPFEDLADFNSYIHQLLDRNQADISLCSVHKAKGLEADRVFILEPDRLPHIRSSQSVEQFKQELNLHYVALTRSKQDLFFVGTASWIDLSVVDKSGEEAPTIDIKPEESKSSSNGSSSHSLEPEVSSYQKTVEIASKLTRSEKIKLIGKLREDVDQGDLEVTLQSWSTEDNS